MYKVNGDIYEGPIWPASLKPAKPVPVFDGGSFGQYDAQNVIVAPAVVGSSTVQLVGESIVMPSTVVNAIATLKNVAQNASNFEWQATMLILALCKPGTAGAPSKNHLENEAITGSMSFAKFAQQGVKGLKVETKVAEYYKVGQYALSKKYLAEMPTLNGEKLAVPSKSWNDVKDEMLEADNGATSTKVPSVEASKFDALVKAIKGMDSADTAQAIKLMAEAIGMDVVLTPKA